MSALGRQIGVGFGVAAIVAGGFLTACSKEKSADPSPSSAPAVEPSQKDVQINVTRTGMSVAPPAHGPPCSGASCTHHRRGGYGGDYGDYGDGGDGGGGDGGGGEGGGGE